MQRSSGENTSIDRRFRLTAGAIYLCVLGLLAWQLADRWQAYADARDAVGYAARLRVGLTVFDAMAAERKPVVALLGGADAASTRAALGVNRQATDARMQAFRSVLARDACGACPGQLTQLSKAEQQILRVRAEADELLLVAPAARDGRTVAEVIDRLTVLPLQVTPIDQANVVGVMSLDREPQGLLYMTGFAASLRKQAQMFESQVATALVLRQPLNDATRQSIDRKVGGLASMRDMMMTSARGLPRLPLRTLQSVDQRFFDAMPSFVGDVLVSLAHDPGDAMSAEAFMERFGFYTEPLVALREASLTLALGDLRANQRRQGVALAWSAFLAAGLTAGLLIAILLFHRTIVRPFVEARRYIQALAAGQLDATPTRHRYGGEIADLFASLSVLKADLEQRAALTEERTRLIAELKNMAETDPLTGLCNRRAFLALATGLMRRSAPTSFLVLTMFDIDHFKRINDTYGHPTGDVALKRLAQICRTIWREDDVVGRVGGEEFAVLASVDDATMVTEAARRLVESLHAEQLTALDGRSFVMTVSFGICVARAGEVSESRLRDMFLQADKLLYRAKELGRDRIEVAAMEQGG